MAVQGAGAVAGVILAVILLRLDRSQIVLQKQDTVEVLDFAARLACLALVAVLATLSPARRALRLDPFSASPGSVGTR